MKKRLIIIGFIILAIIGGIITWTLTHHSQTQTTPTNNPQTTYSSVDFYSADLPIATRQAIKSWLDTNSGVSGLSDSTVTVRKGSYTKNYSSDSSMFEYTFLVDLTGTPHVTYLVKADHSTTDGPSSLYLLCPAENDQIGTPSDCKGQTQL